MNQLAVLTLFLHFQFVRDFSLLHVGAIFRTAWEHGHRQELAQLTNLVGVSVLKLLLHIVEYGVFDIDHMLRWLLRLLVDVHILE